MDSLTPKPEDNAAPKPERDAGKELVEELGRLTKRFIEAVEVAWNSDQRKEIQQDLRAGLLTLADSLEHGLQDIGEKEETKQFVDRAEEVAESMTEKIRTSDTAHELAAGLATGLRAVNEKLESLIADMRSSEGRAPSSETSATEKPLDRPSQDIPIEPA